MKYNTPEMEIIQWNERDIITTSTFGEDEYKEDEPIVTPPTGSWVK